MLIELRKFGTTLVSRQSGKEAWAAFQPVLDSVADLEDVVLDFDGVITFSPSWGDEFITPLQEKYKKRLILRNTGNPSVRETLKMLESISQKNFRKID